MVTRTCHDLIDYYARHLEGLTVEEMYDTEALLVLIARDDLEDLSPTLTSELQQRVRDLGEHLLWLHHLN